MASEQPGSSSSEALGTVEAVPQAQPAPPGAKKYRKIELPTPEQRAQEDFMNNCATRTVLAGEWLGWDGQCWVGGRELCSAGRSC